MKARHGPIIVLQRSHPSFPTRLFDLPDPPEVLACVGLLPDLSRAIAIVGTRACDVHAFEHTRQLARELAQAGYVIVSGGAVGIDTAAHLGALDVGAPTVAVLATGLQRPFPSSNHGLFEKIVERGALVCEHPEQVDGQAGRFLARNRIVAALAEAVVVTQAPFGSGALSTAAHAERLNRPIFGVPHAPWDPRGQGCLHLLSRGARICRTSGDVLTLAAPTVAMEAPRAVRRPKKAKSIQGLDDDQRELLRVLSQGPLDADEMCEQSGLSAPRVQRAVLMLLLSKVIHEVGSGRYARADYP